MPYAFFPYSLNLKKRKERKRKKTKSKCLLMKDIFWLVFLGRYLRIFIGDVYDIP
jgi:uncharacterized membrane protein YccF (DUF307 family)